MTDNTTDTPNNAPNKNVLAFPAGSKPTGSRPADFRPTGAKTTVTNAVPRAEGMASDGMPAGFSSEEDGIYEWRESKEGDLVPVRICSPLVVKGRCRTAGGHGWGRVLEVQDPDGGWHQLVLANKQLQSPNAALAPLFDRGFELATIATAAESVMLLLNSWQPHPVYLRFDRLGWTDKNHDAFVLGNGRVIGDALVTTDSVSEDLMAGFHTKGTLAAWKKQVAAPCVGNPLMMLAVSHAFTGPLLSVLGQTGGGFHLRGLSSRGKSTIQYVATSVWGERSLLQSWDGTPSGFQGIAAVFNDRFLNIEELHKADPRTVGDTIYTLADGRGRLRAKSNAKLQTPQRWRVPILSSGEVSLEAHMASAGCKMFAGQDVRLINLEAASRAEGAFDVLHGSENSKIFAERVDHACIENYGHAGPIFVEKLMRATDKAGNWRAYIDSFCRVIGKEADVSPSDGQVQRVLKRFALAALAGELATQVGLTGWPNGAARDVAQEMFLTWFEHRDGTTNDEIEISVTRTRDYVAKNLDRFCTLGTNDHDPVDGWRDQKWFFILPECWKAIHAENDPVEMAHLHSEGGVLKTQSGGGFQFRMGRDIPERPRVYAIRANALLEETEA